MVCSTDLCDVQAINIVSEENGADKPSKHSPIVWNGAGETGQDQPLKTAKPLSIAERAKEELAAFQGLQSLGIDPAAPAAIKASPSHSGSEAGGQLLPDCCVLHPPLTTFYICNLSLAIGTLH